ncbi:mechanosensitive ion channel family protein [Novilysobacter avium]|uniref:Small-conductance mechanosensitive channel n=1 Tax=Novilysobacter avium TaxID=2781023 RepID=A0A7S6ZU77_9GAMM|nr:mechanosensitive ion channel family protein [Lysobacter avium]QOW20999.1 mechanosensitive ion channel family protein [Lysobacter avium]
MQSTTTIATGSWLAHAQAGEWTEALTGLGIRVGLALLLFLVGRYVISWILSLGIRALDRSRVDTTASLFLRKVASVTMTMLLILASLQVIGVPMTSMIAVLGAAGLAIGLALKDSLSNIASGVMLVTLKPFKVGDFVTIHGEVGTVEAVSIFQTCVRGADNQVIVLPNSLITRDSIINHTPEDMRRIGLSLPISYTADIDTARAIAIELMHADERILAEPAPSVLVYALGENHIDLGVRCYTNNADNFVTKCALLEALKKAYDKAGVSPGFQQREVVLYSRDGEGGRVPLNVRPKGAQPAQDHPTPP